MAGFSLSAQVCTPDVQYVEVGLYPDSLPNGTIGFAYEQVIHVVIPQDTNVTLAPFGVLQVDLCSLKLDSIPNLPAGMTYECNTADCTWEIDHTAGVINRACVTLTGTPTEAVSPDDSIVVYASVTPGAFNATSGNCDPLTIALPSNLTTIVYKTALKLEDANTAIRKGLITLGLTVSPNPSHGESAVIRYSLPQPDAVSIRLINSQGQVLNSLAMGYQQAGPQEVTLPQQDLPAGVYFLEVSTQSGQIRQTSTWIRQ